MNRQQTLMPLPLAAEMIAAGQVLCIAGDEAALRQLPRGQWIGGTIPYFMTGDGGQVSRDQVFVTPVTGFAEPPRLRLRDRAALPGICRDAPESGYSIVIIPAFSDCHVEFAQHAPDYEEMYLKPLVGWIAGVHLDDLAQARPRVVLGPTGEFADDCAVVMDVPLPPERFAQIDIVNLFHPGHGPAIVFPASGFTVGACSLDGQPGNLAEYLASAGIDTRLPLVADYCGALVNVSIKAVDRASGRVELYAPVFPGLDYRIAAPVDDYVASFHQALPGQTPEIAFSCNCILNYLHSGLDGKRTGDLVGPFTFGEIGYQLLNQTLVYLTVS